MLGMGRFVEKYPSCPFGSTADISRAIGKMRLDNQRLRASHEIEVATANHMQSLSRLKFCGLNLCLMTGRSTIFVYQISCITNNHGICCETRYIMYKYQWRLG
jgi:hypothetical protein